MSTSTETEFLGDGIPSDITTVPTVGDERPEEQPGLPDEGHTHDDGDMSPLCTGGGCVQKTGV
ncbi:hypothetical protein Q5530_37280 [Saccharothrix sp. BKS2]|uniref:hypothetical protein n=1 Tax=Saccharothrix sp. BKS2 TaxID=3064400 RepID=UPI0039EB046C